MKKGTKLSDVTYFLEIRELSHNPIYLTSGSSLRELVHAAAAHVPTMDNYSKVYREMRVQLGVYMGLFVVVPDTGNPFHANVIIRSNHVSQADYDRFHALAATLPKGKLAFDEKPKEPRSTS